MPLLKHRPGPPLDRFVACLWYSERMSPLAATERMLPTGTVSLVFVLHDRPMSCFAGSAGSDVLHWTRGIVHGPQAHFYHAGPKPAGAVAGIAFRPGRAGAVLGVPACEFAGRHVSARDLWGAGADKIHERLCEALNPPGVFHFLEQELLARMEERDLLHPAVAHALARSGVPRMRVEDVCLEVDLSPRRFIRLFSEAVGLTPGRYYRVTRFARVLRGLARPESLRLADLAAAEGFSDQSHLVREFHEHAGMTPTQYRPAHPAMPYHHRQAEAAAQ